MRRRFPTTAAVALTVSLAAVSMATGPAQPAAAAGPAPGTFSVAPAPGADGQARPYFQLTAAPGGSVTDVVTFANPTSKTQHLRVGVTDGLTATNSGSAYGPLKDKCTGTACWVIGVPQAVTLAPRTQEELTFQVKVPDGTKPAQYLAGITATPQQAPPPTKIKNKGHGTTQVIIVPRVIIGVAVTVGKLSRLHTKTEITGVTARWVNGLVRLTVQVRNTGQRFTKGNGKMSCGEGGDTRSLPFYMDTVLPGQGAGLQVNGTGMHTGTWRCTARVAEAGGGTATWTGAVTVASTQAAATKRIANNAYVVPDQGGIPGWAIALMVIGGLILLSLWAVLLRRQRNRNLQPPTG